MEPQAQTQGANAGTGTTLETPSQSTAQAPVTPTPQTEDLVSRVSKVKIDTTLPEITIDEPKFDVNDIEKIADPQAKEQALKAYKSFQRGFNAKFQELAELRKQMESKNQPTQWTPDKLRQEINKPDFIQASQAVLQEQNPMQSGMTDTEWSSLTANEKKQWQVMQQELASLKQQNAQQEILQNYKAQDDTLKQRYADYDPQAVDIITNELLSGKRQATREDLWKAIKHDENVKRAYELGKQDGSSDKLDKQNASAYDGLSTGKPATDVPVAEKNESTSSFFGRLVARNLEKQKVQR